jgi:phosphatidate phosphatase APP1
VSRLAPQVISDIDDTLMCSGGAYPAGRDTRYPHACVYPGVLAFYNELDAGHVLRVEVGIFNPLCSP